ncbi:DUF2865 domain-containing protein [Flexibacterium corallicola]|uniref:DUF2865 domain-containing protein n=1 Tax=Flexibacterium corallicola TaxID=3037259 RepID=UPI00286F7846|nr:DUF2865 domain-containing protein [Pseudovibrio sp. M1P-2-3]
MNSFNASSRWRPLLQKSFAKKTGVAALLIVLGSVSAQAQSRNPACTTLEEEFIRLTQTVRNTPAGNSMNGAYERQQEDIRLVEREEYRLGCHTAQAPRQQCASFARTKQQMYANLDKLERARRSAVTNSPTARLKQVEQALYDLNCSAAAAAFTQPQKLYDPLSPPANVPQSGQFSTSSGSGSQSSASLSQSGQTYKTMCVRTCDGLYFPISSNSTPQDFADDEQICQSMCPGQATELYVFKQIGGNIQQMHSLSGAPYSALPTAYKFNTGSDSSCTCSGTPQTASAPSSSGSGGFAAPAGIESSPLPALEGTTSAPDVQTGSLPPVEGTDNFGVNGTLPQTFPAIPTEDEFMQQGNVASAPMAAEDNIQFPIKVEPRTGPIRQVGPKYFADQ